jgi:hypothetical protein
MKYSKLVDLYECLEQTPSRLKKIGKIAGFLEKAETTVLEKVVLLVQGRVFPSYSERTGDRKGL